MSERPSRPNGTIGPTGTSLTVESLPPPDARRWVIRRKAEVVAAVHSGLLGLDEARERYRLSAEEFLNWEQLIAAHGLRGLRNGDAEMSEDSPGRAVAGPFGEPLTVATLPPADTVRWVSRRKAQVVCAIRGGLISRQEACDRYGTSDTELSSWEKLLDDHGPKALEVTRTQRYRQAATSAGGDVQGSRPAQASLAALPGRSDMFRSLKDPDQQPDLGKADRLFALAINGQRFEDI